MIMIYIYRRRLSRWAFKKFGDPIQTESNNSDIEQKDIIISTDKLRNVLNNEKEKQSVSFSWIFSIGFTLFICWVETTTFNNIGSISSIEVKTAVLVLSLVMTGIGVFLLIRALIFKKRIFVNVDWESLLEDIKKNSKNKLEKNLILLFISKEDKTLKFLVQRKSKWHNTFFFPYIEDSFASNIIDDKNKIRETIKLHYSLPDSLIISLSFLSKLDFNSIKYNANIFPQHFGYRFVFVTTQFPLLNKILNKLLIDKGYEYKSLSELNDDEPTLTYNRDVIEQIQDHISFIETDFNENLESKSTKAIWNIDKSCNFNCSFCAYGENKTKGLNLEQKKKIISLLKEIHVTELDFAVGNQASVTELIEVIKYAKTTLKKTKLSLTATANIIDTILEKRKNIISDKKHIDCVDISIDSINQYDEINKLRADKYNEENLNIVKKLKGVAKKIKIQTVITSSTSFDTIKNLIDKLKEYGVQEMLLLRLMPVGKVDINNYPRLLLERNHYQTLLSQIREIKDFKIKLHCSLRGLESENITCDMGCQKLGIAMNGDLYTCPWAEHIVTENNPFRLGNLLNVNSIGELLLDNNKYTNSIKNKNVNQPHCKIFSYVFKDDPYGKYDEIYS